MSQEKRYQANITQYGLRVTITPISLTIGARAEGGYSFWDEERTEREGSFVTAIILNDGSRVETRDSSTSVNIFDQVSYKTIYDGIVNPKDIQQIEFFGQDTLYLGGLDYTNDTKASLDARRLADLTFNMGIFISIISMLISIISMLYLCKSDIYLSFERVQARKKKKGREYSFDQYLALTNKVLLKTAVAYRFFLCSTLAWDRLANLYDYQQLVCDHDCLCRYPINRTYPTFIYYNKGDRSL